MSQTFKLEITLGNDAMQTTEDVARELKAIAGQIVDERIEDCDGKIYDLNGNSVGRVWTD